MEYGTEALRAFSFSRLYWTPPLSGCQAVALERAQIENRLGLIPLVVLSDHDSIEAALSLQVLRDATAGPISVEWTVPFRTTFFHLGVYNLPLSYARQAMEQMTAFTMAPDEARLRRTLAELAALRHVMVVLNHPAWDEKGIGAGSHRERLGELVATIRPWLHAIELNGFRTWRENCEALELADALELPVVGGGDRHGREPSPVLNLTEGTCFEEWVEEVRYRRNNQVVLMPQYAECRRTRLLAAICDVLAEEPAHPFGWRRWDERVFYRSDGGAAVPLRDLWRCRKAPLAVRAFVELMRLASLMLEHPQGRAAVQLTLNFGCNEEAA